MTDITLRRPDVLSLKKSTPLDVPSAMSVPSAVALGASAPESMTTFFLESTAMDSTIVPSASSLRSSAPGRNDTPPELSPTRLSKSYSVDVPDRKPFGSIKRRSIRRRGSKLFEKIEKPYGNDTEAYEAIRMRVLKERAVVNAVEALQERWRMIMYMYHDCEDLNEGRKSRKIRKLIVKRQEELIFIVLSFIVLCVPISFLIMYFCR